MRMKRKAMQCFLFLLLISIAFAVPKKAGADLINIFPSTPTSASISSDPLSNPFSIETYFLSGTTSAPRIEISFDYMLDAVAGSAFPFSYSFAGNLVYLNYEEILSQSVENFGEGQPAIEDHLSGAYNYFVDITGGSFNIPLYLQSWVIPSGDDDGTRGGIALSNITILPVSEPISSVPEPSTLLLLAFALGIIAPLRSIFLSRKQN